MLYNSSKETGIMNDHTLVRILLVTDEFRESLQALPLGSNAYRLENSPWFAYGVSYRDVVEAQPSKTGEFDLPTFVRVLEKSGNRTLRVYLEQPVETELEVRQHPTLAPLLQMGCAVEGAQGNYFAINIPAEVDFDAVCSHLHATPDLWEYADPTFAQLFPAEARINSS
jgi:hypothetical protein